MSELDLEKLCELLLGPDELTQDDRKLIAAALAELIRVKDRANG